MAYGYRVRILHLFLYQFTSTTIASFSPITGTRYHGNECHSISQQKKKENYKGTKQKEKGWCCNLW